LPSMNELFRIHVGVASSDVQHLVDLQAAPVNVVRQDHRVRQAHQAAMDRRVIQAILDRPAMRYHCPTSSRKPSPNSARAQPTRDQLVTRVNRDSKEIQVRISIILFCTIVHFYRRSRPTRQLDRSRCTWRRRRQGLPGH
jgi:hypothetical protein